MINYKTVEAHVKMVEASIMNCKDDVIHSLEHKFGIKNLHPAIIKAAKMPDGFVARAKCHPEDTFDFETGKQIAKKRLLNKYHSSRIRALNRVEKVVIELADRQSKITSAEINKAIETLKKHNK